jgi:hypothetical protein
MSSPEKMPERTGAAKDQKTPSSREAGDEKTGAPKQDEQTRARTEGPKPNDRVDDTQRGNRATEDKGSPASKAEKSLPEKSAKDKSAKEGEKARPDAASNQRMPNQTGEGSKTGPAQAQQGSPSQTNRPAAANEADRNRPSNEAQRGQENGPPGSTGNQTQVSREQTDKRVRISETLTKERLPPPERNLNVAIRVGAEIPREVRVHRLPPEIVSVAPEYRDYEYFATDEDIVIVEPRTRRIVDRIPRDASRARAELQGGSTEVRGATTANAAGGGGPLPCQIMRRDSSGQVSDASSTTVGSTAQRPNSLAVIVQTPDQRSTPPIALDAPAGQIIVATQGQGDCTVTIEPQVTR